MSPTLESLDQRLTAVEHAQTETAQTLRWVTGQLGRMKAIQDEHTVRLERLETKVDGLETRLGVVERKLDGLIESLPGIVTDAVRAARA